VQDTSSALPTFEPLAVLSPDRVDYGVGVVHKIVSAQGADALELPHLGHVEPQTSAFQKLLETLSHYFAELFKAMFPDHIGSSPLNFEAIARGAVWVAGVCIALALTVLLYQLMKIYLGRELKAEAFFAPELVPTESQLSVLLKDALAQKLYARAARLRWRLFLQRLNEAQSLTPREFIARTTTSGAASGAMNLQKSGVASGATLASQLEPAAYGLMFRADAPDLATFETWSALLEGFELEWKKV
jgi:hypothetical protein